MLTLPLTSKTFTRGFLDGRGELQLTGSTAVAPALSPDKPFPDAARELTAAKVGAGTPELRFGTDAGISCTASFDGGSSLALTLVREGDTLALPPNATAPAGDRLGVLLRVGAQGKAAAGATVPAPAGFSFGLSSKAGGAVEFARYLEVDRRASARSVLEAILGDVRLPQARGTVADLPAAGEVVQLSTSGFVELAAALNWGYSLTGGDGIGVGDIEARLAYALRAKAAVTLKYALAGEFALGLTRGHDDGWARITLRKRRNPRFEAAAAFDLLGKADVDGLPESADEFLAAFLGADVTSAIARFEHAVAAADLDALEKRAGKLLSGVVQRLAATWVAGPLEHAGLQLFRERLRQAIAAYRSIDERLVGIALDLYRKTAGPASVELRRALSVVATIERDGLAELEDQGVWRLLQHVAGGDVFALVTDRTGAALARVRTVASQVLDLVEKPDFQPLRQVIDAVEGDLQLDALFGRLDEITDVERLRNLANTTLQGLVERIVGRTFEELRAGDVASTLRELQGTVKKIAVFRETFATRVREALHQSVSLRLNALYARATSDESLVDVEVDVRTPAGQGLFRDAAAGRMAALVDPVHAGRVAIVHEGRLTHDVTRSAHVEINVLGWERGRLVEVIARTEVSLQAHDGGLVQVYATEASLQERQESGRRHKERMQANFLLRLAGDAGVAASSAASRDFLARTIERMSVTYDLVHADDMTDAGELEQYLALGEHLGLVPAGVASDLIAQFGRCLGKVSARYTVRYDPDAVRRAFDALDGSAVGDVVRRTARRLVASALVSRNEPHRAPVGLAYADPAVAATFARGALGQAPIVVSLPGWLTGGAPRAQRLDASDPRIAFIRTLYGVEDRLAHRLVRLDLAIGAARTSARPLAVAELEDAARDVVSAGADMDRFGAPNTFFAVFDALLREGGRGTPHRESALVLEITPPGGETVTRFFMQGPATSARSVSRGSSE